MRPIVWFLLLFAVAVAVTLTARLDQGYVLVVLPPWRLEISFILAAGALALLYVLASLVLGLLRMAISLPADVRAWRHKRRSDQAEAELERAMAAFLAGQPAHALRLAEQAHRRAPDTLAALLAAHAALAAGEPAEARRLLAGLKTDAGELTAARQAAEARLGEWGTDNKAVTSAE